MSCRGNTELPVRGPGSCGATGTTAEGLLQEATARARKLFNAETTDADSMRPWMVTVVRNLVIDHHWARSLCPLETTASTTSTSPSQVVLDALDKMIDL
ncbi:sigma factor [Streptomyces sporangiiformans]|uniref:Uncharacterized protein n=1 Tax=Streptomyces sporangiiformans TaxID=2315329 RepID=A0A505DIX1_9ACTN|nr:sigma factor [Streptomyces sporangiiformans]TPQ21975.1 hypothetical protein FGD71_012205 [Streptomyces sporangiiformans]